MRGGEVAHEEEEGGKKINFYFSARKLGEREGVDPSTVFDMKKDREKREGFFLVATASFLIKRGRGYDYSTLSESPSLSLSPYVRKNSPPFPASLNTMYLSFPDVQRGKSWVLLLYLVQVFYGTATATYI